MTDLSATPKIDREHPPDLKQLADGAVIVEALKAVAAPAAAGSTSAAAKAPSKPAAKAGGKAAAAAAAPGGVPAALDVARIVDSVISRVSSGAGEMLPFKQHVVLQISFRAVHGSKQQPSA